MNTQSLNTWHSNNLDLEKDSGRTDKLSAFRQQVGITDVLESGTRTSKRKASNIGLYNRIAIEEREAKWQYISCALLINTCLLAQIVLASALTALGAGSGSHTQITILGAANTVIAALLTFTKGQGLPNRLRQYQCSLRKVREYIEQRERDFAQLDCKLDLNGEIRVIKGMYEDARQNDGELSHFHEECGVSKGLPDTVVCQRTTIQAHIMLLQFPPPKTNCQQRKHPTNSRFHNRPLLYRPLGHQ